MGADGSGAVRLTPPPHPPGVWYTFTEPDFSSDGARIAYAHAIKFYSRIAVIAADASAETVFHHVSHGHDPSFSPDGARIAFTRGTLSDHPSETQGISVVNADGSGEREVPGTTPLDAQPVHSPDGRRFAFTHGRGDGAEILTMALDGSDRVLLTASPGSDREPDWAPGPPPPPQRSGPVVLCPAGTSRSVRCSRDGSGRLVMLGTNRAERFIGTSGAERIFARGGADVVIARGGDDRVSGGSGADRISGGSGDDVLSGAGGRDRLSGAAGDDRLAGGDARDLLLGGDGDDRLSGGRGSDRLLCGAGRGDRAVAGRTDRVGSSCERGRR